VGGLPALGGGKWTWAPSPGSPQCCPHRDQDGVLMPGPIVEGDLGACAPMGKSHPAPV
jgi:hypothetical protein